jgi:hypothetical protein
MVKQRTITFWTLQGQAPSSNFGIFLL